MVMVTMMLMITFILEISVAIQTLRECLDHRYSIYLNLSINNTYIVSTSRAEFMDYCVCVCACVYAYTHTHIQQKHKHTYIHRYILYLGRWLYSVK